MRYGASKIIKIEGEEMRKLSKSPVSPTVTIRVSGHLSQGHLSYLDQLVASAIECALWPLLDLTHLEELDRVALSYLMGGEGRDFGLIACPGFIREWMQHEKERSAA
jgi:hypothetical protein